MLHVRNLSTNSQINIFRVCFMQFPGQISRQEIVQIYKCYTKM